MCSGGGGHGEEASLDGLSHSIYVGAPVRPPSISECACPRRRKRLPVGPVICERNEKLFVENLPV